MIEEIQKLLDEYVAWLKDKTSLRQIDDWVEITTPYLDRHNDFLQFYARTSNGGFLLTDDGHTINDLEQSGCKLESPKRQDLLRMTLNGFGVQLHDNALEVHASGDNFALRKHNLAQAMLAVNDMFYLAVPLVANLFFEDVVVPKSQRQPERILQTVNRPNRDTAQSVVLAWIDTKEVRSAGSKAYALLNDSEQPVSPPVLDALRSWDVHPVPWTRREEVREELSA